MLYIFEHNVLFKKMLGFLGIWEVSEDFLTLTLQLKLHLEVRENFETYLSNQYFVKYYTNICNVTWFLDLICLNYWYPKRIYPGLRLVYRGHVPPGVGPNDAFAYVIHQLALVEKMRYLETYLLKSNFIT